MANFYVLYFNSGSGKYEHVPGPETNPRLSFLAVDGTTANGIAAIQTQLEGHFIAFPLGGAAKATLTTALAGTNDDLTFTAVPLGPSGNSITVRYVVAGNNTALSVSVTGNAITVNIATSAGGAATSTATQVRDAVNAHVTANTMVSAAYATGNDGTGVVSALAATALTGGNDGSPIITNTQTQLVADSTPLTLAAL